MSAADSGAKAGCFIYLDHRNAVGPDAAPGPDLCGGNADALLGRKRSAGIGGGPRSLDEPTIDAPPPRLLLVAF
jgi:hypothetical protein